VNVRRTVLTGVILAGGASRRMGEDKAFLDWDGRPLIAAVAGRLREVCRRVVAVASGEAAAYQAHVDLVVRDVFPDCGVVGGIHAGLAAAGGPVAVVGCDMPFVNPEVLDRLASALPAADAAALRSGPHAEPLHAVYGAACGPRMEEALRSGERRAQSVLGGLEVRWFRAEDVRDLDPDLRCLRNVNTPAELEAARRDAGLPPRARPSV